MMGEAGAGIAQSDGGIDHDSATRHRKTLLGVIDLACWEDRLRRFMAMQPGFCGQIDIGNLVIPESGGSSGTILFDVTYDMPDRTRVTQGAVLRHATEGGLFHSYDLSGQYSLQEALQGSGVLVPGLLGLDPDGSVLGAPGYVMTRIDGVAPPPTFNSRGVLKDASPEQRREMLRDVLGNLARLHKVDPDLPALAFLKRRGEGRTPAERDINWYWASLSWGCPDKLDEVAPFRKWLIENEPADMPISVCHGDTMLANYMFRDHKLIAVLDWELAFLGNPAHDIAYQYLSHKLLGMGCTLLEGLPDEEGWKAEYEAISGTKLRHWEYCSAETAYKMHIALLLVYRETAPGMEAARDAVLDHTRQTLADRVATAQRAAV